MKKFLLLGFAIFFLVGCAEKEEKCLQYDENKECIEYIAGAGGSSSSGDSNDSVVEDKDSSTKDKSGLFGFLDKKELLPACELMTKEVVSGLIGVSTGELKDPPFSLGNTVCQYEWKFDNREALAQQAIGMGFPSDGSAESLSQLPSLSGVMGLYILTNYSVSEDGAKMRFGVSTNRIEDEEPELEGLAADFADLADSYVYENVDGDWDEAAWSPDNEMLVVRKGSIVFEIEAQVYPDGGSLSVAKQLAEMVVEKI